MAADEPKKRLLAYTGQDTHGVTTSGINTLLVSAFKRGQANEKKVQDLLAVLSSNIQHFCSSFFMLLHIITLYFVLSYRKEEAPMAQAIFHVYIAY